MKKVKKSSLFSSVTLNLGRKEQLSKRAKFISLTAAKVMMENYCQRYIKGQEREGICCRDIEKYMPFSGCPWSLKVYGHSTDS